MLAKRICRFVRPVRNACVTLAAASLLCAAPVRAGALANSKHFSKGALIIPMQTSFQDACGLVSAYGLVYQVLAANYYLVHTLHQPAITVHWVYNPSKDSPNRCVPTNLNSNPQTPGSCLSPFTGASCPSTLPYQDPKWNQGCDFQVTNTLSAPVTLVDNKTGGDVTATPAGSFNTNDTTSGVFKALAYPNFTSVTVQHSSTPASNVTTVQYMGGAFVIDAPDAPNFIALLTGTTVANDFFNSPIDFSPFRTTGSCGISVSGGVAQFTTAMPAPNTNTFANVHYVKVHSAQTAFDAADSQKMSDIPAKIALLITAGGQEGFSSAANGIKSDMLPAYLASAGLGNLKNAQGCPPQGFNAKHALTNCPNGAQHGLIFDAFDVFDLADSDPSGLSDSLINERKSPPPPAGINPYVYQNLWVPHWEGTTWAASATKDGSRACDNTCVNQARNTISRLSLPPPPNVRKIGLLAECSSIGVIEGVAGTQSPGSGNGINDWWYPPPPDPAGGYPDAGFSNTPGQLQEQIVTCNGSADGGCTGKPLVRGFLHEVDTNGLISNVPLHNCTDPDLANGANCVYYAAPGDPFAQLGDQMWFPRYGLLSDFTPYTGSTYVPEWSSLAFLIAKADTTKLGSYQQARAQAMSDVFSKDVRAPSTLSGVPSDPKDSSFNIYLGGHSYASDVAGTRVVLNTMLALGTSLATIETGVASPTAYNGNIFVGTYQRVRPDDPNTGIPPEWISFNPNQGSSFHFPYHTGAVRAHPLSGGNGLGQGANDYKSHVVGNAGTSGAFDTDVSVPPVSPGSRNIFTYLGGDVQANPSLGAGRAAPPGGLQTGWTPIDFDYPSADPTKGCVDKFRIGEINSTNQPAWGGPPYAGMLPSPDGVCDLQEALELTTLNMGTDHGASEGAADGGITAALLADVTNAQELIQLVRGFCYATVGHSDGTGALIPHPAQPTDCNYYYNNKGKLQGNSSALGGVLHSQPAIIPASTLVQDAPTGKHRPTVLYVGALDGMLHALYLPSDGNDSGYSGPAATLHNFNADASSTFTGHTPFIGPFTPPTQPLTELWSFIPPGQLPLLKSNNARVDSSPAVIDVFGNFGGTGVREWHTVLVASAGGSNREIFALDVTNPLTPVLLWDIDSSFESRPPFSLQYAPVRLANDDTGLNTGTLAQAFQWQNGCHDADAGVCTPANFVLPPANDPGRNVTGAFNYFHLGASSSVSAAPLRRNNGPVFAAFVATNEPADQSNSGNGVYLFAIDLVTGQKLWEFNNPYMLSSDPAKQVGGLGNNPPAGVTLFSKAGNAIIDTAYLGDEEGSLWEIDAADGVNLTSYASVLTGCTGKNCNFPLSQAFAAGTQGPQPISTLSTLFIVPPNYPAAGPLNHFTGQALLTYGTAGTDTISGLEPANGDCSSGTCISGFLHLLPIAPSGRYSAMQVKNSPPLQAQVQQNGVAIEVPGYPLQLPTGERLFGSIVAAGTNLFFSTNAGAGAQLDAYGNQTGASYQFSLTASINAAVPFAASQLANTNFGGAGGTPLLFVDSSGKNASLVAVTDQKITFVTIPSGAILSGPTVNGQNNTPATFLGWFFRRRGSEY